MSPQRPCNQIKLCLSCGAPATKLCDFKLLGVKEGKTCDRPLCVRCAKKVTGGLDYCPGHHQLHVGAE